MNSASESAVKPASGVANLFPGYFALVMATGIVSIASFLTGVPAAAWGLLVINIAAYIVLWLLLLIRIWRYPQQVIADLTNHGRSAGFFTVVAGTCVLGSQFVVIAHQYTIAAGLWLLGLLLWVFITYAFFTVVTTARVKPSLEIGLNGSWLISVVAAQSVSVLTTLLVGAAGDEQPILLFAALCLYLLGGMLYIPLITLILYRFTFFPLIKENLTPPYWINMGAVAITTLAGASLILNAEYWSLLTEILPFLKGFTLFFWATATWWIPLLLLLGIWRHLIQRFPLRYDPQYWGMVFPLGMYTTCTIRLSQALELPFLMTIAQVFIFAAWAAWTVVFIAMLRHTLRSLSVPTG
ncbi:MAG: tellurite resistance/C4-dicarboxylate transporter family protein [Anaerolineae bacterium]|nr:tellurite resistance/C4-dicarboxylate transporter family protein [Anaerolineae bacterium]NUQ05777.1 tellurite resistance/C4-dicarboxylate transporter family protein [Anaerolineae bacterium]